MKITNNAKPPAPKELSWGQLQIGGVYRIPGSDRLILRTDEGYVSLLTGLHFGSYLAERASSRRYVEVKAELVIHGDA